MSERTRTIGVLILVFAACFVVLFGGKHIVDTGFFHHPSNDLLDIFR